MLQKIVIDKGQEFIYLYSLGVWYHALTINRMIVLKKILRYLLTIEVIVIFLSNGQCD